MSYVYNVSYVYNHTPNSHGCEKTRVPQISDLIYLFSAPGPLICRRPSHKPRALICFCKRDNRGQEQCYTLILRTVSTVAKEMNIRPKIWWKQCNNTQRLPAGSHCPLNNGTVISRYLVTRLGNFLDPLRQEASFSHPSVYQFLFIPSPYSSEAVQPTRRTSLRFIDVKCKLFLTRDKTESSNIFS